MDLESVLAAWRANNKITLAMLDYCSDEDLELKPGKGKTIRSNFVHLIGMRRAWCEQKLKKEAAQIEKLDWQTATLDQLRNGLNKSSEIILHLLAGLGADPKPGKWNLPMFFAYAIAHEANHRAQIEIAWRLNKREPEIAWLYSLWEWDKLSR